MNFPTPEEMALGKQEGIVAFRNRTNLPLSDCVLAWRLARLGMTYKDLEPIALLERIEELRRDLLP